ncbi:MAG: DUF5615 family PIN-like protein [Parvularculaceae bacterium]
MSIRFLADECCPSEVVAALRSAEFDVAWVLEDSAGASDSDVIDRAAAERRVLVTEDKDFGELAYRSRRESSGICLLRLTGVEPNVKQDRILRLVTEHKSRLAKCFTVVERSRFRFRPLIAIRNDSA